MTTYRVRIVITRRDSGEVVEVKECDYDTDWQLGRFLVNMGYQELRAAKPAAYSRKKGIR